MSPSQCPPVLYGQSFDRPDQTLLGHERPQGALRRPAVEANRRSRPLDCRAIAAGSTTKAAAEAAGLDEATSIAGWVAERAPSDGFERSGVACLPPRQNDIVGSTRRGSRGEWPGSGPCRLTSDA